MAKSEGNAVKILITGGRGFLGAQFHKAFADGGHDVTVIDLQDGKDALDFFRWNRAAFDLAIHAAGYIGGRLGIENERSLMGTNAALDSWFFRWLDLSGTKRAVTFSSSAAYPVGLQFPGSTHKLAESDIDLDNPRKPDSVYGTCKILLERLGREAREVGKEILTLRIMSSYGPTQSLDYPWPSFLQRAQQHDSPFVIWGDGSACRDWIAVEDVIDATLAMLDQEAFATTNVGTGIGVSFNELALKMCQASNYVPTFEHLLDKPVGVHYRVADTTFFNSFYEPRISLEQGIEMALQNRVAA
jgi:nucleoside-diphosphate-sugar epimerase